MSLSLFACLSVSFSDASLTELQRESEKVHITQLVIKHLEFFHNYVVFAKMYSRYWWLFCCRTNMDLVPRSAENIYQKTRVIWWSPCFCNIGFVEFWSQEQDNNLSPFDVSMLLYQLTVTGRQAWLSREATSSDRGVKTVSTAKSGQRYDKSNHDISMRQAALLLRGESGQERWWSTGWSWWSGLLTLSPSAGHEYSRWCVSIWLSDFLAKFTGMSETAWESRPDIWSSILPRQSHPRHQ